MYMYDRTWSFSPSRGMLIFLCGWQQNIRNFLDLSRRLRERFWENVISRSRSVMHCVASVAACRSVLPCVAVCRSVLQCVAACRSVVQCVALCVALCTGSVTKVVPYFVGESS